MAVIIPASWFVEPVTVSPAAGRATTGPPCRYEHLFGNIDPRTQVQRGSDGDEALSEQTLRFSPSATTAGGGTVDPIVVFTVGSEVTVTARDSVVLSVKPFTVRGQVGYVEVRTT